MQFPREFVWGVATSSYQIEGAVRKDGRGESIWDRFSHTVGNIADGSNGDVACDHYHRYRDDVGLMKKLGVDAYRFSIAWPRIIPQGSGTTNQRGLDFYSRLVDTLLAAGITPFVTLYHWDLPQALENEGGWRNRDTALAFADYVDVVSRHLGDRVKYWITHNEPWCTTFLGYYYGVFAPGVRDFAGSLQTTHNVLLSHGLSVPIIRQNAGKGVQVGIAPNYAPTYPASDKPEDIEAAQRYDGFFNRWFIDPIYGKGYPQDSWDYYGENVPEVMDGDMDAIAAPIDFLGINYYNPMYAQDSPEDIMPQVKSVPNPALKRTADREIMPEGLFDTLIRIKNDYGNPPIYITENGAAFDDKLVNGVVDDSSRIAFLQAHFEQAKRSIEAGVALKGFFVWSLMDNFEWASGYTLRYGITYVNYDTQERTPKASALWYRDFIAGQKKS